MFVCLCRVFVYVWLLFAFAFVCFVSVCFRVFRLSGLFVYV